MSKRKHYSAHAGQIDKQQAQIAQIEAVQLLLFTMDVLGERRTTVQMEIEGVLESVIITRCTQLELEEFLKNVSARSADADREAGRAADAPLT